MIRLGFKRLLQASSVQVTSGNGYKNYVMSDTLAQLEHYCEKLVCPPPWVPSQKVTIIGASSDIGQVASLVLKQEPAVKKLALYDDIHARHLRGVANDIAHIDTTASVEMYQGWKYLKDALEDTDVVLICGGNRPMPPACHQSDKDVFFSNMKFVRTAALAIARFTPPETLIVVQTPPVDCNFPLVKYTLKRFEAYDRKKLFGMNAINAMRARSLYAYATKIDPATANVPVIGGTTRCTRVPVFTGSSHFYCAGETEYDNISRLIRELDDFVCCVKSNCEQAHLSIGYSTGKFVASLLNAMVGKKPVKTDCAFVEMPDPSACYGLKYCSVPLTVDVNGIKDWHIPSIGEPEKQLLEYSKCDLEDLVNLGRCYGTGDEYVLHPPKVRASPAMPNVRTLRSRTKKLTNDCFRTIKL